MSGTNLTMSTSRMRFAASIVLGGLVLSACTTMVGSSPSPLPTVANALGSPTPTATPAPTPARSPAASETDAPTAVPISIDPCDLVTQDEASTLAGASFGPGKESTTSGGGKICTYGSQTLQVLNVEVVQARDAQTAESAWTDAQAALSQHIGPYTPTQLPAFADGTAKATVIEGSTLTFRGSGIYVLRDATFFTINELSGGAAVPSSDDLQAQALTALGRLP